VHHLQPVVAEQSLIPHHEHKPEAAGTSDALLQEQGADEFFLDAL